MTYDLGTDDGLRRACREAPLDAAITQWRAKLRDFLSAVRGASPEELASRNFQTRLWDDNPISAPGMGQVKVDAIIDDPAFRIWLAEQSRAGLPEGRAQRTAALAALYDELLHRTKPCGRRPYLKIFRVLAALFPLDFTTIASKHALKQLQYQMFGPRAPDPVTGHQRVRHRIDDLLGPFDPQDINAVIERLTLPWMVYALVKQSEPGKTTTITDVGEEKLQPLPAARRRRGLTAFGGMYNEMLSILEYIREEPTRDELLDHLRSGHPKSKDATLRMIINIMTSEFGVIRHEGTRYVLTARGDALLESGDPDELRDWLLTRILGVDHVIAWLRDSGPKTRDELDEFLQGVNPGWTTTFAPRVIVKWLQQLDIVESTPSGSYELTPRGREWGDLIEWTPERLAIVIDDNGNSHHDDPIVADSTHVEYPGLTSIIAQVDKVAGFSPERVASLHMGLWAHERRHFAILTGLSGSGKTLLARAYAQAIIGDAPEASRRFLTIPVQPGWYDPTPLFGYVNPLTRDSYESTPFLELLLHAVEHPRHPHVAVLDEMNLSHPEQYLAQVLSAMETGAELHLHSKGAYFDGIPDRVPYPSNLVLIGTVNMDETTLGLSDKVLDRAFTLEFWTIDPEAWPGWSRTHLSAEAVKQTRTLLIDLMDALESARLHFGWRVIDEIVGFLSRRDGAEDIMTVTQALDRAVYAKIIPKLRGEDAPRFRAALDACERALARHQLEHSRAKVKELQHDLESTGSARFWR